jgi:IS30 family transposase
MQWSEMIAALNAWGVSKAAIARKLDLSKSTVSDLANGHNTDPRWSNGDVLIKLYREEEKRQARKARRNSA